MGSRGARFAGPGRNHRAVPDPIASRGFPWRCASGILQVMMSKPVTVLLALCVDFENGGVTAFSGREDLRRKRDLAIVPPP